MDDFYIFFLIEKYSVIWDRNVVVMVGWGGGGVVPLWARLWLSGERLNLCRAAGGLLASVQLARFVLGG